MASYLLQYARETFEQGDPSITPALISIAESLDQILTELRTHNALTYLDVEEAHRRTLFGHANSRDIKDRVLAAFDLQPKADEDGPQS